MSHSNASDPTHRSIELEARFAWLERHVAEQDKVIFELGEELRRLKLEAQQMRKRLQNANEAPPSAGPDERPPHY